MTIFLIIAYLVCAIAFSRFFVRNVAKKYSALGWTAIDSFVCCLLSLIWPIYLPLEIIFNWEQLFGSKLKPPTFLPFTKWHEKDQQ